MVRSNGTRIACWLVRNSLDSKLLYSSPNLNDSLRSRRGFVSNSCNLYRNFGYRDLENAKFSSGGFLNGVLHGSLGSTREIHGTGSLCRDYYDTLGVSKKSSASEIKKAYHGLAKKLHPDTNKGDASAAKKFQEVQKAYEVLKDNEKRSYYDQVGHDAFELGAAAGGPGGPFDGGFNPFEDIFKGGAGRGGGGGVNDVVFELSFMEAVRGCFKTVTFQTSLPCEACGGTGVPPGTRPETCQTCRGLGSIVMQSGPFRMQSTCTHCSGTGKAVTSFCKSCKGDRVVRGPKTVNIDVMPGIDNNETIKIPKSGGADPDGNQPGDLYITINVREDPVFRREGLDIHVDAVVSATQAILGGTVQIPTLTGDVVLKVRVGTQPGQKVVLKRKGIKTRNSASFGDQYVHFNVSIPTNLTLRQRELIEEFAKEQREDYKGDSAQFG
ncbi:hypothetical protein MKW94_001139 [Papaver nudicaule]|uniref:Uncharacterized protein n=1 Tax=Papaver nudicaule TaxID=74823 RepID=A0AA41SLR4_PAPNU|nr:hypothetical protein [Papaver nudicaule]